MDYGYTIFEGKEYDLTSEADYSNRSFDGCFQDADDGQDYWMELCASAVDDDGVEYLVTWIFTSTKGEEAELDSYDYSSAYDVVPA